MCYTNISIPAKDCKECRLECSGKKGIGQIKYNQIQIMSLAKSVNLKGVLPMFATQALRGESQAP